MFPFLFLFQSLLRFPFLLLSWSPVPLSLSLRFFRGRTQMEVADEIGISQAQVSRLEKGALERIKRQL